MGKGLQRPGGRVWERDRAGVGLDGKSAGMGLGVLEWEERRGQEGELCCGAIGDGMVIGKVVK